VITQNKKIATKLRFIYSMLTSGDVPKDEMAEDGMDEMMMKKTWQKCGIWMRK
jgi:hypothetical protein